MLTVIIGLMLVALIVLIGRLAVLRYNPPKPAIEPDYSVYVTSGPRILTLPSEPWPKTKSGAPLTVNDVGHEHHYIKPLGIKYLAMPEYLSQKINELAPEGLSLTVAREPVLVQNPDGTWTITFKP